MRRMNGYVRMLIALVALCLMVAQVPPPVATADTVTYRALLIGNNEYQRSPLKGCVNDAKAMRSALQLSTGISYSRIELATDLTANGMLAALDTVRGWGQSASDVTLIYYSGHGFSNADGTAGIIGVDMYGVSFAVLEQRLARITGTVAVVMDSCYAGGLIGKSISAGGTPKDFNDALIGALTGGAQPKALNGSKYHVITACSTKEQSYEAGGYGYFTTGVTESMGWNAISGKRYSSLIGDADKDSSLTVSESCAHASKVVSELRKQGDQNVKMSPAGSQLVLVNRKSGTSDGSASDGSATGDVRPGIAGLPNLAAAVISPGWKYQLASSATLSWKSSNTAVATVSQAGLVTGVKAGKATITGKRDGKTTVSLKVEVTSLGKVCQKVTLNATSGSRTAGSGFTLRAAVSPQSAKRKAIRWHSSDKSVATVSKTGAVRPIKPGSARIYAIGSSGEYAVCNLTVTARKVDKVEQKSDKASVGVGKVLQLKASALPKTATNRKLSWSSADETIAVIGEESGIVRGIKKGKVYVTAESTDGGGASSRVLVTVK